MTEARILAAVGGAALLFVPAAGAVVAPPRPASASVTLSSTKSGARPVGVNVRLRWDMQCARPGPGPVMITFPAAERLPAGIAPADVLVDGQAAPQVQRSGRTVSVGLPIQHGPLCDVIAPAVLEIAFTPRAGLGNPLAGGRYVIEARTPRVSGHAAIVIR